MNGDSDVFRVRVVLDSVSSIGPGKVALLEAIDHTGSISAAARSMNMSYRRAWNLVNTMNSYFHQPVVRSHSGGRGGGGATVTAMGHTLLDHYRTIEHKAQTSAHEDIHALEKLITAKSKLD